MISLKYQWKKVAAVAAAFFLFSAIPAAVHAQQARAGLVVTRLTVQGNVRNQSDAILAETGIRAGDTIVIRDIQNAIRRLWATGSYKTIEPQLSEADEPNHVALTW